MDKKILTIIWILIFSVSLNFADTAVQQAEYEYTLTLNKDGLVDERELMPLTIGLRDFFKLSNTDNSFSSGFIYNIPEDFTLTDATLSDSKILFQTYDSKEGVLSDQYLQENLYASHGLIKNEKLLDLLTSNRSMGFETINSCFYNKYETSNGPVYEVFTITVTKYETDEEYLNSEASFINPIPPKLIISAEEVTEADYEDITNNTNLDQETVLDEEEPNTSRIKNEDPYKEFRPNVENVEDVDDSNIKENITLVKEKINNPEEVDKMLENSKTFELLISVIGTTIIIVIIVVIIFSVKKIFSDE